MVIPFYTASANKLSWTDVDGNNEKSVLVVGEKSDCGVHLGFLKKVLSAVNLDFEHDIHFLSVDNDVTSRILAEPEISSYRSVLVFGLPPGNLGLPDINTRQSVLLEYEKLNCLWSPLLETIESNPDLKKKLWGYLKSLFHV